MLGAGDAFMAGFLRGWLRGEPLARLLRLRQRLRRAGRLAPRLRAGDAELDRAAALPRRTARPSARCARTPSSSTCTARPRGCADWPELAVLAFDHRIQLEELAGARRRAPRERIAALQGAARRGRAARRRARRARQRRGLGVDRRRPLRRGRCCRRSPASAAGSRGRSSSRARGRSRFEAARELALALRAWPTEHVAKCLVSYHPDDPPALRAAQLERLQAAAARPASAPTASCWSR